MKPYLLGQGVFHFVDGSMSCPPSHVSDSFVGSFLTINSFFIRWKQQYQLILSVLLSFLSMDVLHLVVDCHTSYCVWRTLKKALASPSNSPIIQLYGSFQDPWQGDASVTIYMQQAKPLFDKFDVAGRPISLEYFNLYVFHGLRSEFKDLITSLVTMTELLSYADLHNHLFTHEFLHKNSLNFMDVNSSLLSSPLSSQPQLLPTPSTYLATFYHNPNFSRNRVRSRATSIPTITVTIIRTGP